MGSILSTILLLTTVHHRYDTRIFIKEAHTLASNSHYKVMLMVADGKGNNSINRGVVSIYDLGQPTAGRFGRVLIGQWRAFNAIIKIKPTIVHFHDPELIPLGLLLKAMGHKVIYDAHEDVPSHILDRGWLYAPLRPVVKWVFEKLEQYAANRYDAIITAAPVISRRFINTCVPMVEVKNYPMISDELSVQSDWSKKERALCYISSSFAAQRGIVELIMAMEKVNATLYLAGHFNDSTLFEQLQKLLGWKKVKFLGYLNHEEIARLVNRCRIGVSLPHPIKAYLEALPTKMFEYMLSGIPVVSSDFPSLKSIVNNSQCGICVNPQNPNSIAESINYLLDSSDEAYLMGQNGRKAVLNIYNWKTEAKNLLNLYNEILTNSSKNVNNVSKD